MLEFQVPRISSETVEDVRGSFAIEPLDRGFGYTFGNSLRRVLLSSLEGAAVTSVKIEGVAHEFTTLPGVREDVTDIILNLKQLVCILHGESPCRTQTSCLRLSRMSVTSSRTPGSVVNSCATPSSLTEVTAAPSSEESSTRRSELPNV